MTRTATRKKLLGRFDTPRPLSQAITNWAIKAKDDTILEPSCGGGVFLRSAEKRLRILGSNDPYEQIRAYDIDPDAINALAEDFPETANSLELTDFLKVGIGNKTTRKVDCSIGNPPYVSLHQMSKEQRLAARQSLNSSSFDLGAKASLWAYFVTHSCAQLNRGGRIAFVLSQSLLHVDYARGLLKQLSSFFRRVDVISIRERCFLSEGTKERVAILLADGWEEKGDNKVRLHEAESIEQLERMLKAHGDLLIKSKSMSLNGHSIPYVLGKSASRASKKIDEIPTRLGDFLAIKIGIVTGANNFFVLSEDQRKACKLSLKVVDPILSKFPSVHGLAYTASDLEIQRDTGERVMILSTNPSEKRKAVLNYLETFPETKRAENVTFTKREHWHRPIQGDIPDAFIRYMGNHGPCMLLNDANINSTNTIHRAYFKKHVSKSMRLLLAVTLHSTVSQLSAEFEGRSYGSGVLKLEPSEALRIRILIPQNVHHSKIRAVHSQIDKLLRRGERNEARILVDNWLKTNVPEIQDLIDFKAAERCLVDAYARRNARVSS